MNNNKLKSFATQARTKLMQGVAHRLVALGFNADGTVIEEPVLQGGGATFMGNIVSEDFYDKWMSLQRAVQKRSVGEIAEEAAYTWFNRLMAIRIMARNHLISPVLEYEDDGGRVPVIVAEARQGRSPEMDADTLRQLSIIIDDDRKTEEQFALLITAFCHSNPILNSCFGRIADYTELLLPSNILADGGFVAMLNETDFIDDNDYKSPELIGWLYQYYISERKDEVMSKKGKYTTDEIPAATQIFTPNWIVKYMVQNTVGRIYLDNNPYSADDFKPKWKYLVESEDSNADHILKCSLEELKVADLACGSGHILNECFDLLYDLYIAEGYSRRQAIENIFANNLTGVDIDTRAKQLATFALLLKACQKDESFADAHAMPRVLDMPKADRYTWRDLNGHMACALQLRGGGEVVYHELDECFALMEHADSLGSIMKFDISPSTRDYMLLCLDEQKRQQKFVKEFAELFKGFELILALTEKYHAIIMNPPYMGGGYFNDALSKYVKDNYEDGKADLMTVFMMEAMNLVRHNGYWAMINLPSWMFLGSFETLRRNIVAHQQIIGLLHNGRGIFGSDFGSVTFVMQNAEPYKAGCYRRLFKEHVQVRSIETIHQLYLDKSYGYYLSDQKAFRNIPGSPISYWIGNNFIKLFNKNKIGEFAISEGQNITGDNDKYIKFFWEIAKKDINPKGKWPLLSKGGPFRKWYGNVIDVIDWSIEARTEYRNNPIARIQKEHLWFRKGITWNLVTSLGTGFRLHSANALFNKAAPTILFTSSDIQYFNILLGFLNTRIVRELLKVMNPTINTNIKEILSLPFEKRANNKIDAIVNDNVAISRADWDAHETSWDFQRNELLTIDEKEYWNILNEYCDFSQCCVDPAPTEPQSIEWRTYIYQMKWWTKLLQLHSNEEELNRQFIDIYGLQDELTPDVPLDEVTILQQGEISVVDSAEGTQVNRDKHIPYEVQWHNDVLMKQFISYAVGCMMGRYSIDKPGLILANQGDGIEQFNELVPNSRFEVDDDGIIPLMPSDTWFNDNATLRFKRFVATVFGEKSLNENLNFIEKALGKNIDTYFVKDFWKDHTKMYQKRPIYWLFSSKKGAFQCLAYMHRMNAYTAEQVRSKYLLPHIEWLVNKAKELEDAPMLNAQERRELDSLHKQIEECREYHDRLHDVADHQIAFDLDDGVVVNYAKFGDVLAKIK